MMQAAGLRLIANLCQQPQPGVQGSSAAQQQQQQPAAANGEQRQQRPRQQQQASREGEGAATQEGLVTPCGAKAGGASPRIPAHRGSLEEDPATRQRSEQVERLLQSAQKEPGSRPPPTPQDHPAEAQIAAAALTMGEGDPTEALIAMLEKAMAGRRQHLHGLPPPPPHL